MTPGLSAALRSLDAALEVPRSDGVALGNWRWVVRQRISLVRDALIGESTDPDDGWLAARGGTAFRERNQLLGRLGALGPSVLENADVERVRDDVKRLLVDISRHVQRLHDIAYDDVEMELGGSE
ncbi:hypothetical protein [Nocardioides sp.]|uniref:hypothetical protein n=1 Tax=Nocardioides sp. TaxID=35761 RepID=UPI00286CCEE0|nr:hypothetical protein [Nocardioides sp.]